MITAQCHLCKEHFEVPTTRGANLVMMHQIPCRSCYNKREEE
jgi:hypothetical protein